MSNVAGDPVRSFSPEEERQLTIQLVHLVEDVGRGVFVEDIDTRLLCTLHRRLFDGVRDHAGYHRSHRWGSEHLSYGPNRSSHRNDVPARLDALWPRIMQTLRAFVEQPNDPDYERKAVQFAAWAHAEVIRIHPFEDGNGRTSRLLLDILLVRTGLPQIPVEACKQEYLDVLNHYYDCQDIEPLVDLLLRAAEGVL